MRRMQVNKILLVAVQLRINWREIALLTAFQSTTGEKCNTKLVQSPALTDVDNEGPIEPIRQSNDAPNPGSHGETEPCPINQRDGCVLSQNPRKSTQGNHTLSM